tara:strand:+ start:337 stop:915 length:579 start_codon:yes stop_codon:yes gene_type:complete
MAKQIPIYVNYSNNTPVGIAEYQTASQDYIPAEYGGTGQTSVSRGQIIVGDLTDADFKAKKFTDTDGLITCVFDETWLTASGQPVNQVSSSATQFYAGETVYQGQSVENATATGIIIENTGTSTTFKVKSVTGTFTAGEIVWAKNTYNESNQERRATLSSATGAITEQSTMKFFLGTLNATIGEYVVDCGTL